MLSGVHLTKHTYWINGEWLMIHLAAPLLEHSIVTVPGYTEHVQSPRESADHVVVSFPLLFS